jgi:hypothetical protein
MDVTESFIEEVVSCIKDHPGRTPKICCVRYGMSVNQYDKLVRAGVKGQLEGVELTLFNELEMASAKAQSSLIDNIREIAASDWRAAQVLLKALNPGEYSDNKQVNVNVSHDEAVVTHRYEIDANDVSELLGALRAIGPGASIDDVVDAEVVE